MSSDQGQAAQIARVVLASSLLVLPGALAIFALWLANRRLLRDVAIGHALEQTGSRAPNERDLEERQLRNVVEEMAIAAGLQPPRLRVIDSEVVNAGAVGVGVDDATVLVTRGLLDKLDRDETQAVVGHVVGSIGNGDLKIVSIDLLDLPDLGRAGAPRERALRGVVASGDLARVPVGVPRTGTDRRPLGGRIRERRLPARRGRFRGRRGRATAGA